MFVQFADARCGAKAPRHREHIVGMLSIEPAAKEVRVGSRVFGVSKADNQLRDRYGVVHLMGQSDVKETAQSLHTTEPLFLIHVLSLRCPTTGWHRARRLGPQFYYPWQSLLAPATFGRLG